MKAALRVFCAAVTAFAVLQLCGCGKADSTDTIINDGNDFVKEYTEYDFDRTEVVVSGSESASYQTGSSEN